MKWSFLVLGNSTILTKYISLDIETQEQSPSRDEDKSSRDEDKPTRLSTPPIETKLMFSHERMRTVDPIYQSTPLYHSRSSEDIHHIPCPLLLPTFPNHPNNVLHLQYLQQQIQEYYQQQSRLRMYYHPEPMPIKPKV